MRRYRHISGIAFLLLALALQQYAFAASGRSASRVYVHLDNTSYLLGEDLCFSATAFGNSASEGVDSLLHVELLAPEGYVVESRNYWLKGGRCHGMIHLRPSLLSGLFEFRAYTPAMLEADTANYFTAVVPIIDGSIPGNMSIYDRRRKGVSYCPESNRAQESVYGVAVECDTLGSGRLRMHLVGIPGSRLSLSVKDSCRMLGAGRRASMADHAALGQMQYMEGHVMSSGGKSILPSDCENSVTAFPFFSPAPRTYTKEEKALAAIPGVRVVKPLLPKENTQVVGITHSAIHTTFTNEIRWAKVHGMDDVDFRQEPPGLAFLYVLQSICKRYGYPFGSPYKVRVVSVKGEYPGDSLVPDYLRIYDGGEFSMDDYGEVIIRTDSAICEAFSYGRHAPYYDMGRSSRSISIGSRSRHPTGMPAMVICIVPNTKAGQPVNESETVDSDAKVWNYAESLNKDVKVSPVDCHNHVGRTMYWNPDVVLDGNGEAIVEFEGNSDCERLAISAEGITPNGQAVVYKP